jgi:hypothetical protein
MSARSSARVDVFCRATPCQMRNPSWFVMRARGLQVEPGRPVPRMSRPQHSPGQACTDSPPTATSPFRLRPLHRHENGYTTYRNDMLPSFLGGHGPSVVAGTAPVDPWGESSVPPFGAAVDVHAETATNRGTTVSTHIRRGSEKRNRVNRSTPTSASQCCPVGLAGVVANRTRRPC